MQRASASRGACSRRRLYRGGVSAHLCHVHAFASRNQCHRCCVAASAAPRAPSTPPDTTQPASPPACSELRLTELHGGTSTRSYLLSSSTTAGTRLQRSLAPRPPPAQGARSSLAALFLPPDYPRSVTPDYLPYQLATLPAHVTGWVSHSLTTSSLLKAVGVDAGPAGTAATTAAIKWILKDGIGAAGRYVVGGRFAREFDDDPRRWRMLAEGVMTVGLALEVATALFPQHFLLLACTGNFARAAGKAMGKPVQRVVLTHFAAAGNVGAVAAKEEVWEVTAQLAGYLASVGLLQLVQESGAAIGADSWPAIVSAWVAITAAHVSLRWVALSQLVFPSISHKRACLLAAAHVAGRPLPAVRDANRAEPMLAAAAAVRPSVHFGVSLEDAWGGSWDALGGSEAAASATHQTLAAQHDDVSCSTGGSTGDDANTSRLVSSTINSSSIACSSDGNSSSSRSSGSAAPCTNAGTLAEWVQLYKEEGYLLGWRDGAAHVAVKEDSGGDVLLRAMYQAAWLDAHAPAGPGSAPPAVLSRSLEAMQASYAPFLAEARVLGWDTSCIVIQAGEVRVRVEGGALAA